MIIPSNGTRELNERRYQQESDFIRGKIDSPACTLSSNYMDGATTWRIIASLQQEQHDDDDWQDDLCTRAKPAATSVNGLEREISNFNQPEASLAAFAK